MTPLLIQTQSPAPHLSVSVWRETSHAVKHSQSHCQYRKIWKDEKALDASAWLSWAHHEHLMLSLLSQRSIQHVVKVSGLQVADTQVELITLDAGPDFLRDWLMPSKDTGHPSLWSSEIEAIKWMRACLKALLSIHSLGVIHGDLKADNLCVSESASPANANKRLNLNSLTLIDFAYALYREAPLKCVLPTDPERLDYLPDFYRQALQSSQASQDPSLLLSVACANIDLFSLSCLLQQTVEPNTAKTWRSWSQLLYSLAQIGCKQQKTHSFWGSWVFDQPTKTMLQQAESELHRLKVPHDQWDFAATTCLARAAVTPLMVETTPMVSLTPLIAGPLILVPNSGLLPLPVEKPKRNVAIVKSKPPRSWVVFGLILNVFVFALIDKAYVHQEVVLSDVAYGCGLLSIVLGLLLAGQTVRYLRQPQPNVMRKWALFQAVLIGTAMFFSTTLRMGAENALLVAILVVQMWIWVRVWQTGGWHPSIE